jgi:tetratricopeptide (TPR) repeat protein
MSSPQSQLDDLQEAFKQAQELRSQGNMAEAIDLCCSILEVDDRHIAAYHQLAQIYENQRNFAGAIENYKKAIEIDSDSPFWVYRHLGFALRQQEQLEEAVEAYRKAIVLQPDDIDTYNLLGQVLEKKGDIDGSISSYQKAIELNPETPIWVYLNLGDGLSQKERWEEAIEAYTKALELEPKNAGIRRLLVAVTARKEADEIDPVAVAKRLQGEGKLEEALFKYRSVLEKDGSNLVALHQVAQICEGLGNWDEAVVGYRRAIEVDTEPPFWVYRHLGFALSQRGDLDGAVTAYEKAARILLGEVLGNKRGYLEPKKSPQLKI